LDASDLEAVFELIGQGQQALVVIPSNMPRADYDALTEQLIDVADRGDAMISAIQVGSARPRGWSIWLARLNATRTLIVTPKVLGDPKVVVTWLPKAQTGAERLVVGEFDTLRPGSQDS